MKKHLMLILALVSINAHAFTGTGNDMISNAREYMRWVDGDSNPSLAEVGLWQGTISGLSSVFYDSSYKYAICYPKNTMSAQLAEIAANYVIEHPEERNKTVTLLTWVSHFEAFGLKSNESCSYHDEWKAAQS